MLTVSIARKLGDSAIVCNYGSRNLLASLPVKLRVRVARVFDKFLCKGITSFLYDAGSLELPQVSKDTDISVDAEDKEILDLLVWYLGRHIYLKDGGVRVCNDCGETQPPNRILNDRCQSPKCPSHEMWEKIFDGYIRPKETPHPQASLEF